MVAGTPRDGLFGQSLLIARADYEAVGGHERVRDRVLENARLAAILREAGTACRAIPGRGILSFRMYPRSPGDLIEGWTKGFAAGAGTVSRASLLEVIAWFTGLMLPLVFLFLDPRAWIAYLAFAVQAAFVLRAVGSFSPLTALLYPLPLAFYFAVFARSSRRSGHKVTWKGREFRAN